MSINEVELEFGCIMLTTLNINQSLTRMIEFEELGEVVVGEMQNLISRNIYNLI